MASWRDAARPIVARVLMETRGQSEEAIRKALFEAYPFEMRQYTPYRIWLDEIKRQRGKQGIRRSDLKKLEEWEAIYGKRAPEAAEGGEIL